MLGHFPTGVTIGAGLAGDEPAGFTVGSFTSVSLDPPLVGALSPDRQRELPDHGTRRALCVNALCDDQTSLCFRLAASGVGDDRFDDATCTDSPRAAPSPKASTLGTTAQSNEPVEFGDHYIVVGCLGDPAAPASPTPVHQGVLTRRAVPSTSTAMYALQVAISE